MVVDRVYPCVINGKYYFEKVDFDKLVQEQADKIIEAMERVYNTPSFKFYHDDGFKEYINLLKSGDIDGILYPKEAMYRAQFDLAVLEYGSFEFVQRIFLISSDEEEQKYFEELDKKIADIQNTLTDFCQEQRKNRGVNYTQKMQKIYTNFLVNFAPQRLGYYTTPPIDIQMIEGMYKLKEEALKSLSEAETYDMTDKFTDFNSLYRLDTIVQVISLYEQLSIETDKSKQSELAMMIDGLTKEGVLISGNNQALINLANTTSKLTLNEIIDSIVLRLKYYRKKGNVDISEDFEMFLEKFAETKRICSVEELYTGDMTLHKLVQLSQLEILPEREKEQLNDYLDNEFGRKDIEDIDMSEFDKKIAEKEQFSDSEVKEFYQSVMRLTVKNGEMPIRYNEYFLARLIEENPEFSRNLDDIQKALIIEHFASNKSKQLVGNQTFITFSTHFFDRDGKMTLGEHQPGFIKLRPITAGTQSMEVVLNIVTILHELKHEQQQKDMDAKRYNHLTYMMEKERVFKADDHEYYNRNYFNIYEELDAEHFALKNALSFLKTLPIDEEFRSSNVYKEIVESIEKKLESTEKGFEKADTKEFKDGKMVKVEEAFDQLIAEHPELVELKPIFKVEYNEDGSKKTVKQIFEELTRVIRVRENRIGTYDLYKYVLFSRIGRDLDECIELSDIKIPTDLPDSTRLALGRLKYAVASKGMQKVIPELNTDEK